MCSRCIDQTSRNIWRDIVSSDSALLGYFCLFEHFPLWERFASNYNRKCKNKAQCEAIVFDWLSERSVYFDCLSERSVYLLGFKKGNIYNNVFEVIS